MQGKFSLNNSCVKPAKQASSPEIIFHDSNGKVINGDLPRKTRNNAAIVSSFALAALDDEPDDETVTPSFYFNIHRSRLPSVPVQQLTEEKREQLFQTSSPDEFEMRDKQILLSIEHCEKKVSAAKKRQMEMRAEMRNLLQQYLDLDREHTEELCRLRNAVLSREELHKRRKIKP